MRRLPHNARNGEKRLEPNRGVFDESDSVEYCHLVPADASGFHGNRGYPTVARLGALTSASTLKTSQPILIGEAVMPASIITHWLLGWSSWYMDPQMTCESMECGFDSGSANQLLSVHGGLPPLPW